MQTSIKVNSEAAEKELQRLASAVAGPRRKALMQVLGKGLESDLQAHFMQKNKKGNKRGFPTTNFWNRIRTATAYDGATMDNATVRVSDPAFATHLFGANITPRNAKYLAIPNTDEAYGNEPRGGAVEGLFFAENKQGTKFLARKGPGGELEVHYWLKRSVRVPKDKTALPDPDATGDAAVRRATRFLDRQTSA